MNHKDLKWYHSIVLLNGEKTKGDTDYSVWNSTHYLFPDDLTGKSVIDFGTFDGYWAIETKKRGAAEVVAVDGHSPPLPTASLAPGERGIPLVSDREIDLDVPLSPKIVIPNWGNWDAVLFYGIVYHMKNPVQGLKTAAAACKPGGTVIVESAVCEGRCAELSADIPAMWLIDKEHNLDPTNYVMPNESGLLQRPCVSLPTPQPKSSALRLGKSFLREAIYFINQSM